MMVSKLFNLHIMKYFSILIPPQFNFVPIIPVLNPRCTLMGFTTFIHPNHSIVFMFMNEYVAFESNK
jgi:hypothetical protein